MSRYWKSFWISVAFLLGAYVFWRWCLGYILPFVFGSLIAVLLQPIAAWFESHQVPRSGSAILSLAVGGGGTLMLLGAIGSLLIAELLQLSRKLPQYLSRGEHVIRRNRDWEAHLVSQLHLSPNIVSTALTGFYHVLEGVVRSLLLVLVRLPNVGLVVVIGTVTAYFLIRDRRWLSAQVLRALPPSVRPQYQVAKYDIVNGTLGFLKAEAVLVFMTAAITTAGLLMMGIRYGVLVGIMAGLLDLIPYLGPTVILGPWIVVAWLLGQHMMAVKLLLVLLAVAVARQTLEPRLVGSNMGVHPLVAVIALYIGIRLFGASGVVIGPITALMLKVVYRTHRAIS